MNFEFRCNSLVIRCKARNTKTANKIIKMLPIKSSINTWGDEIYFEIKKSSIELEKDSRTSSILEKLHFGHREALLPLVLDLLQRAKAAK